MRSLMFGVDADEWAPPSGADGPLVANLGQAPMALADVDPPGLRGPEWTVLRTRMTGICGSDAKQVLMDFDDSADNPMTALISFPQVLGHEVVADVAEAGPESAVEVGDRVVLYPNLGCAARGLTPPCPACSAGDYSLCERFTEGALRPGIHTGNSVDAPGGFAEQLPAHRSMLVPVPDDVPDEVAVLADPFSVSLHAVTRHPPPEGGTAVVYGAGALGTCAVEVLRALYPSTRVAVVARFEAQAALSRGRDAHVAPADDPADLIERLAEWSGGTLQRPWDGLAVAHPGGVDVVYDTVGSPETVEVAIRLLRSRGTLVQLGVSSPGRFEWTPWYFKELRLVGSNAFGMEEVEGRWDHAMAHYLRLAQEGRIDLGGLLTHTFPLEEWREAFVALADQAQSGAVKVAFDMRSGGETPR